MRLRVTLKSKDVEIRLGLNYKEHLQALIYKLIGEDIISKWLHDKGFVFNNRKYKMFTFSGMIDKYIFDINRKEFVYEGGKVSFLIDSGVSEILYKIVKGLTSMKDNILLLGKHELSIEEVVFINGNVVLGKGVIIKAIEPIEVHRTDSDGHMYYFNPMEKEYSEYINENLRKKWMILNKVEKCPYNIVIRAIDIKRCKERVQTFKGTVIKGWTGYFECIGDKELIEIGLGCGLGSSNSKGYGMIEIIRGKNR